MDAASAAYLGAVPRGEAQRGGNGAAQRASGGVRLLAASDSVRRGTAEALAIRSEGILSPALRWVFKRWERSTSINQKGRSQDAYSSRCWGRAASLEVGLGEHRTE